MSAPAQYLEISLCLTLATFGDRLNDIRCQIAEPQNPADRASLSWKLPERMLRRLRGWRRLIRTRRMAELTAIPSRSSSRPADLAINHKRSDNNEVRPRFSRRDNAVASSQSGRTYS